MSGLAPLLTIAIFFQSGVETLHRAFSAFFSFTPRGGGEVDLSPQGRTVNLSVLSDQ